MISWTQIGPFLPIASLADSWTGPVVLADETQTIRWFVESANKESVTHSWHARDDDGAFMHENAKPGEEAAPVIETREVDPAFWAMAEVVG